MSMPLQIYISQNMQAQKKKNHTLTILENFGFVNFSKVQSYDNCVDCCNILLLTSLRALLYINMLLGRKKKSNKGPTEEGSHAHFHALTYLIVKRSNILLLTSLKALPHKYIIWRWGVEGKKSNKWPTEEGSHAYFHTLTNLILKRKRYLLII